MLSGLRRAARGETRSLALANGCEQASPEGKGHLALKPGSKRQRHLCTEPSQAWHKLADEEEGSQVMDWKPKTKGEGQPPSPISHGRRMQIQHRRSNGSIPLKDTPQSSR